MANNYKRVFAIEIESGTMVEFPSQQATARALKTSPSSVSADLCGNRGNRIKGHVLGFTPEEAQRRYQALEPPRRRKPIEAINVQTGEITWFPSVASAIKAGHTNIYPHFQGKPHTRRCLYEYRYAAPREANEKE